jgi:hypothetical protein
VRRPPVRSARAHDRKIHRSDREYDRPNVIVFEAAEASWRMKGKYQDSITTVERIASEYGTERFYSRIELVKSTKGRSYAVALSGSRYQGASRYLRKVSRTTRILASNQLPPVDRWCHPSRTNSRIDGPI